VTIKPNNIAFVILIAQVGPCKNTPLASSHAGQLNTEPGNLSQIVADEDVHLVCTTTHEAPDLVQALPSELLGVSVIPATSVRVVGSRQVKGLGRYSSAYSYVETYNYHLC
jgi:hypothetical protein